MNQEKWDFMAQPKVMKAKNKFRESDLIGKDELVELPPNQYFNLMWDKRVIRGNTYATVLTEKNPIETKPNLSNIQRISAEKSKEQESPLPLILQEPGTPKPLPGREHALVETDEFVETLTDKPPFYEKEIQTEFNIEKPTLRHYLPGKNGLGKETQIWDGDLFDFDYEVEPILQVLLGKTLELSRMEVLEEEELKIMKQQQEHYARLKREEMEEIHRLEEKERSLLIEIEKKKFEHKKIKDLNINSHKKIITRIISKNFLKFLKPKTLDKLENLGVFRKSVETSFYRDFVPWICLSVQTEIFSENKLEQSIKNWLNVIQNEEILKNKQRVEKYFYDREEKRKENLRLQHEKEERIKKRKEEKARLAEIKRRIELKNEIQEKLISRGEIREKLSHQFFSDIDGCDKETPYVGLFGGIIGELIFFFSTLKTLGFENIFTTKKMERNITLCLNLLLGDGTVEIGIDEKILIDLPKIDESLNFENILTMQIDKLNELKELLIVNMTSLIVSNMIENYASLNLDQNIIQDILYLFFKYAFEQENAKNIKLIKLSKNTDFKSRKALCHVFPLLEDLPFAEEISEKKEKERIAKEKFNQTTNKSKDGKDTNRSKDSEKKLANESIENSIEKEVVVKVESLPEAEVEEKFTVFPPILEDFKVLVLHKVAQEIMRREFIDELKLEHNELVGREYEILRVLDENFNSLEVNIMENVAKKIDIFHIEMY